MIVNTGGYYARGLKRIIAAPMQQIRVPVMSYWSGLLPSIVHIHRIEDKMYTAPYAA